jgi:hypothetical protein
VSTGRATNSHAATRATARIIVPVVCLLAATAHAQDDFATSTSTTATTAATIVGSASCDMDGDGANETLTVYRVGEWSLAHVSSNTVEWVSEAMKLGLPQAAELQGDDQCEFVIEAESHRRPGERTVYVLAWRDGQAHWLFRMSDPGGSLQHWQVVRQPGGPHDTLTVIVSDELGHCTQRDLQWTGYAFRGEMRGEIPCPAQETP